jgi:chaperone BCS1
MGLDDASLNSLISSLPEQCVAIMEDIDAAFTHGLTRDISGTELEDPRPRDPSRGDGDDDDSNDKRDEKRGGGDSGSSGSRITLSGLLNALDGISAQEGRILFATTNRYHALDPALTRPGRMDLHVEFRLASRYQARELYKHFYLPRTSEAEGASKDEKEDEGDEVQSDSGYVTPTKEEPSPTPTALESVVRDAPPNFSGTTHSTRSPKLSRKRIEQLAEQFASHIPEREFSMASLQGYLMSYKTRASQAVDDVEQWIKDTRETRDRRADSRTVRLQG